MVLVGVKEKVFSTYLLPFYLFFLHALTKKGKKNESATRLKTKSPPSRLGKGVKKAGGLSGAPA